MVPFPTVFLFYFNPRSREGSDLSIRPAPSPVRPISIHAPVKGATRGEINFLMLPLISIHAPVKGATSCICLQSSSKINFNPRSREGSD